MTTTDRSITIALVDDHDLVREGLKKILEAHEDLLVVGEAGDSSGAVELIADKRPQVVLLDIEIPGDEVTTTVHRMREVSPDTQVVILSIYEGPHLLRSLVDAGVRGYLLKSIGWRELVSVIRGVREDDDRIQLSVSRESLGAVRDRGKDAGVLSAREREILQLVAEAFSNTQIAHRLGVTEATVKRHLSNIYSKLDAGSRIDAVNRAVAESLIAPPQPGPS